MLALRARQQRNFIATLLLSQGVPMILHGDELGRTQQGNNNTYCQDSELSWINWDTMDQPLVEFTAVVNRLRHKHPTFRRSRFFDGRPVRRGEGEKLPDIVWLNDGRHRNAAGGLGQRLRPDHRRVLNGDGIQEQDYRGRRITDDNFLLDFNAHDDDVEFTLPARSTRRSGTCWWTPRHRRAPRADRRRVRAEVAAKSMVVLRAHSGPEVEADYSAATSLAAMAEHERLRVPESGAGTGSPAEPAPEAPAKPGLGAAPRPRRSLPGAAKGSTKDSAAKGSKAKDAKAAPAKKPRTKRGPAS